MKTIRDTVKLSVWDLIWDSVWNGVNNSLRRSIVNCILSRVRGAVLHVCSSMSRIQRSVLRKSKELMNEKN